jgi:hypothetical protein
MRVLAILCVPLLLACSSPPSEPLDSGSGVDATSQSDASSASDSGSASDSAMTADSQVDAQIQPPTMCAAGIQSSDHCDTTGVTCESASVDLCCRCLEFPAAPSCGLLWGCVAPADNSDNCPSAAPDLGSACDMPRLTCGYCGDAGPQLLRCGSDNLWAAANLLDCSA